MFLLLPEAAFLLGFPYYINKGRFFKEKLNIIIDKGGCYNMKLLIEKETSVFKK